MFGSIFMLSTEYALMAWQAVYVRVYPGGYDTGLAAWYETIFKKKDEDGSGNLDLDEVQTMLRETFNADTDDGENVDEIMNLSDKEISSLALYFTFR